MQEPTFHLPSAKAESLERKHQKLRLRAQELEKLEYKNFLADPEDREAMKIRMKQMCNAIKSKNISQVFFLDKGARLVGHFFNKSWDILYPDAQKPKINFINFGKEKPQYEGKWLHPDSDYYSEEAIDEVFGDLKKGIKEKFGKFKKGQNIALIDELRFEGSSLSYLNRIFQQLYPDAQIFADWFRDTHSYFQKSEHLRSLIPEEMSREMLNMEKLKAAKQGLSEPEDAQAILADSWTKKNKADKGYAQEMRANRLMLEKLALEMLPARFSPTQIKRLKPKEGIVIKFQKATPEQRAENVNQWRKIKDRQIRTMRRLITNEELMEDDDFLQWYEQQKGSSENISQRQVSKFANDYFSYLYTSRKEEFNNKLEQLKQPKKQKDEDDYDFYDEQGRKIIF